MKPPARSDAPILDTTVLRELRALGDDDAGFLKQLLELFYRHFPGRVSELHAALSASSAGRAAAAAHTIKGSCAAIGALRLAGLCEEIEEQIACEDFVGAAAATARLEAEYLVVKQALDVEVHGGDRTSEPLCTRRDHDG